MMTDSAKEFFKKLHPIERKALCNRCGISLAWLNCLIYQDRQCSAKLAMNFELYSKGKVSREEIRPDIDWNIVRG